VKSLFLILPILLGNTSLHAQSTDCKTATVIPVPENYCSETEDYTITDAMRPDQGWFTFTALRNDVVITVTGGTLQSPEIVMASQCGGTRMIGAVTNTSTTATYYRGGLIIGQQYYIGVNGSNTGTFQLCVNNYSAMVKAGQDCSTAALLCTTESFTQADVSGAGINNDEAKGTCLSIPGEASESNSVWYKWQAANNGSLVFTITPKITDDIDFVLYDLGLTNDCSQIKAANAIRCAAGHGVDNTACITEPIYYKTGLDFNETDVNEATGCGSGQNGKLKFVTMQAGHYYALLLNNFSNKDNSFLVEFKDQAGVAGTGTFVGPVATISYDVLNQCTPDQSYNFISQSVNYKALKWSFGDGASTVNSTDAGPINITYATPGIKTVTLEAINDQGCSSVDFKSFTVGASVDKPLVSFNGPRYCLKDTIRITTDKMNGLTYHWTGPNSFASDSASLVIPVTSTLLSGTYVLTASNPYCSSDTVNVIIPTILNNPTASFYNTPALPAKLAVPISVNFYNQSVHASHYLWNFGDGTTSTDTNPVHEYIKKGKYTVTLTAYQENVCMVSFSVGEYNILDESAIFIPNTFTPNGDGVNDELVININNLKVYNMQIYNRWGAILFETRDVFDNWNGTCKGKAMPAGVYYYVLSGVTYTNQPVKQTGYITLLR
jgi:gliding motility-associated-like protein